MIFQKKSIQQNIQNLASQKYSIQKVIHFRISEQIQFKNIIQNWIFLGFNSKTSQELRMLSSVTINCQVRMIV